MRTIFALCVMAVVTISVTTAHAETIGFGTEGIGRLQQLIDLNPGGSPVYREVATRSQQRATFDTETLVFSLEFWDILTQATPDTPSTLAHSFASAQTTLVRSEDRSRDSYDEYHGTISTDDLGTPYDLDVIVTMWTAWESSRRLGLIASDNPWRQTGYDPSRPDDWYRVRALSVEYIPEPSTAALAVVAVCYGMAGGDRLRH